MNLSEYSRRPSGEVRIGRVVIGGGHPVAVQSMTNTDTNDTEACAAQIERIDRAGGGIVRLTAQGRREGENLANIVRRVREDGFDTAIVADIHFVPEVAAIAAKYVDKVRINPGNYRTDHGELEALIAQCRERGVALRIGVNHGSLSKRVFDRWGDTPQGMVVSAMEFLRVCKAQGFDQVVVSMKSSNTRVMVAAYRLLVEAMDAEDMHYPIHLGVTEAGNGIEGRIKSAVGIGSLLTDGIGDTLRVSLTEDAVREVPVAYRLSNPFQPSERSDDPVSFPEPELSYDPLKFSKRQGGLAMCYGVRLGWEQPVRVAVPDAGFYALQTEREAMGDMMPELSLGQLDAIEVDPRCDADLEPLKELAEPSIVTVKNGLAMEPVYAFRLLAARIEDRHLILLKDTLVPGSVSGEDVPLTAARNIGSLLCDGIGDAVLIQGESDPRLASFLGFNILQATGTRLTRADYVSCPSCGRTLYNIQEATARIRKATEHLKGVKIAVMGCIVNGPGEMADADFGYVGGAPNKINLYVKHTPVKFNIPQEEAVERLVDLIREYGRWVDPK